MFDMSYVHVLVSTDHKFSLECMQNFISNMSLITNRNWMGASFNQSILSWRTVLEKNNTINIQMHLGNQERSCIPVSLSIAGYKYFFSKT